MRTRRRKAAQRGYLSPFMFGLILGMSVFSVMSQKWAMQELAEVQARKAARAQAQAEDIAGALAFATLTETRGTYSEDYSLERARQYASRSSGKTSGGQDFLVVGRQENNETFGKRDQRVAVAASDDTLLRAKVYNSDDRGLAALASSSSVALLDTGAVRARQVQTSNKAMEGMAEQVYAFYAAHMRFPDSGEFDELAQRFPYVDAWGGKFDYTYINDGEARLEFVTPWNYTQSIKLSLQDE
ncbi:MAG: hypothetical protein H6922_04410 [Pseudomonadaceae bacterium]|nr:hypothetical protein [Pseudomonadaceae bacterium]